jgi:Mg-chelatase subunit ChlD
MLRITRLLSVVGLSLGLAGALPAASPPSTSAATEPVVFTLVDRWQDPPVESFFTPLDWPAGHATGGIGFERATGTVYAVDRTDAAVRVYAPGGAFSHVIGGPGGRGNAVFSDPFDVEGLPNGMFVVSDRGDQRLKIVTDAGVAGRSWAVDEPRGLATVRRGSTLATTTIYVISEKGRSIEGFNVSGKSTGTIALASGLYAPLRPTDLAFLGDVRVTGGQPPIAATFLVADPGAGGVIFATQNADTGSSPLAIDLPEVQAAAVWRSNWLTVPQTLGGAARLAGAPGLGVVLLNQVDGAGRRRVPFDAVTAVDVAPDGTVYAAVEPFGLIALGGVADFAAQTDLTFGFLEHPDRIAAGERVLVLDESPDLRVWDTAGGRVGALAPPIDCAARAARGARGFEDSACRPVDLAATGARHFVLLPGGGVHEADLAASELRPAGWEPLQGGNARPVAIDADGDRLAVLDLLGQEVWLLGSDWTERARWSFSAGGFKGVMDLAIAGDRIYLVNQQSSELEFWTADGLFLKSVRVTSGPLRVAAGPDGAAYVLTGAGWVFMYGPDGEPLGAWPAGAPKDRPADIDVGSDGRAYIADPDGEIRVFALERGAPAQLPPPTGDKACALLRDKGAEPREIWIGESVEVQLRVDGECPVERKTADVVLAIDHSGSMSGNKLTAALNAAISFVALTDPLLTRVGVVAFDDEASVLQGLSGDRRALVTAISRLGAEGGTDLIQALDASHAHIAGPDVRPGAGRVIVFMSDGRHTSDRPGTRGLDELPAIIEKLRRDQVQVYAIGLGADADAATLRQIASSEAHYFFSPSAAELRDIYVQVARRIEAANLLQSGTLTDIVPRNMTFIPGSGEPTEPEASADGKTLTWRLTDILEPGFLLSYRVRPDEVGDWPTNVEADLDYLDGLGHPGRLVFPIPRVRVLGPTPTPTDTPTPTPTPTDTPTPTPSSTATATPTPTASPTPLPAAIYLPLLIREKCDASRLHVILVLDTSTSMAEPFRAGDRPKIEALRDAVRAFLRGSRLGRDTVTLVRFSGDAGVAASGSDRALLERAVDGLALTPGTRIDLGLELARRQAAPAGSRPEERTVVVLLSDGSPTQGTRGAALASAAALQQSEITLYTVAVGADADIALMGEMAGSPDRALVAADAETLVGLYARVAGLLAPCVPSWAEVAGP